MNSLFQLFLTLVAILSQVFTLPLSVDNGEIINKSYFPNLADRIESLKASQPHVNFNDPDCNRTAGYYGENHNVFTFDEYILGIQRIPSPQFVKPDGSKKPVVLLWHGLQGCSVNWITNMPNNSLGFMLADAGYDVWLGNSRGNTYSTAHQRLSTNDKRFWEFSWDEMAAYDLPATIEYILQVTGQEQLYYVGHSQGTLIAFAQFSSNLNFAKKIKAFFALAPVAHVGNVGGPRKKLAPFENELDLLFEKLGYNDVLPYNSIVHKIEKQQCKGGIIASKVCNNIVNMVVDDQSKLNQSRMGVILSHCPAGTSTQNMAHWLQMVKSDLMQAFDYNFKNITDKNKIHYGQHTPPIYNVSLLEVPTMLFHSDADQSADPTDVAWLLTQISDTVIEDFHYADYTHMDFIWALRPAVDVYPHILSYIKKQESSQIL